MNAVFSFALGVVTGLVLFAATTCWVVALLRRLDTFGDDQ